MGEEVIGLILYMNMHTFHSDYEIILSQKHKFRLCWFECYSQAFLNVIVICKCSQTLQKKSHFYAVGCLQMFILTSCCLLLVLD